MVGERSGFEWDEAKAATNERKHGITFAEACTVFEDVDLLVDVDPRDPSRFVAVGFSSVARVLVVVHAARSERIRIISARRATFHEEGLYAERRGRWTWTFPSCPGTKPGARRASPYRLALRRGTKRAVFLDDDIVKRFGSDEELEQAVKALLAASDHVRRTG